MKWRRGMLSAFRLSPMPSRDGQRAAPVVVPDEGLAAGGGGWSSAVDPGVPLGPGLLATCSVFHGPHVRIVTASMTTAIMANVRNCMRLSAFLAILISSCLGDQRQDALGEVDSNDL